MAPEVLQGEEYNGIKVDIFSAGVILFIMTAGYYPFAIAEKTDQFYKWIMQNNEEEFWKGHDNVKMNMCEKAVFS